MIRRPPFHLSQVLLLDDVQDCLGKSPEVIQPLVGDRMHNLSVHGAIGVDGDVPKSDSPLQALG